MTDAPSGCIKVFGSAMLSVAPNRVIVEFGIRRRDEDPGPAFAAAKEASASVLEFLRSTAVRDIRSSQISLFQGSEQDGNRVKHRFYQARIAHKVASDDLESVDSLLVGAIEAGANELKSVNFVTTELGEARSDARRMAIAAARAKAELYAEAAGVVVGEVAAIEDANPDAGGAGMGERGRASVDPAWSDGAESVGHAPGSIEVVGRVHVWYRIERADE